MVKHIVLWDFKQELDEKTRREAENTIREKLEAVQTQVSGVVSLQVVSGELSSCTKDIALISAFESEQALQAYQVHPAHVKAGEFIKSVTCQRTCFDYEEEV